MKATKPTFQETTHTNRFRECLAKKKKASSSHFKQKNKPKSFAKSKEKVSKQTVFRETLCNSASGSGQVSVVIKQSENRFSHEKKTGALSPRAPEKIKQNRANEMKVYGEKACLTLFKTRPESIVRAWATVAMSHKIGKVFHYLASNKKAYHVVSTEELACLSGTEHHGGICFLVKKPRTFTLAGYLSIPRHKDALLVLNQLSNAYNLGSIVRTSVIFGVTGIVSENLSALYNPATMRLAEGGMEYVRPLSTENTATALQLLREQGYQIIHLSPNQPHNVEIKHLTFSPKVAFVLSEAASEHLVARDDLSPALTPTNPLQTELNLGVATGIVLSQWAMAW